MLRDQEHNKCQYNYNINAYCYIYYDRLCDLSSTIGRLNALICIREIWVRLAVVGLGCYGYLQRFCGCGRRGGGRTEIGYRVLGDVCVLLYLAVLFTAVEQSREGLVR